MLFGFRLIHVPITLLLFALWFQKLSQVSYSSELIALSYLNPKALFTLTKVKHGYAELVM